MNCPCNPGWTRVPAPRPQIMEGHAENAVRSSSCPSPAANGARNAQNAGALRESPLRRGPAACASKCLRRQAWLATRQHAQSTPLANDCVSGFPLLLPRSGLVPAVPPQYYGFSRANRAIRRILANTGVKPYFWYLLRARSFPCAGDGFHVQLSCRTRLSCRASLFWSSSGSKYAQAPSL